MNFELQKNDPKAASSNQENSRLQNDSQSLEDFQQIHNEDVINAKQSQESAKIEAEIASPNPDNNSREKLQDSQNSNQQQNQQQQQQEQENPKSNDKKLNILYFIGVNSLIMNALFSRLLSFLNNIWIQILIIALANIVTYISLYKCNQTKKLFNQIKEKSCNKYENVKSRTSKKKVLIIFGVLLCLTLVSLTVYQMIRIHDLKGRYHYLLTQSNNNHFALNTLRNDFNQRSYQQTEFDNQIIYQYQVDIQRQEQINNQLSSQIKHLEQINKQQAHQIEQLMLKLNLNNGQTQQTQQQNTQQQKQTQQPNQNQNQRQTEERPDYPKMSGRIRDQVRCPLCA